MGYLMFKGTIGCRYFMIWPLFRFTGRNLSNFLLFFWKILTLRRHSEIIWTLDNRHGVSEEETRPLNPNRNDYEDIENPFKIPGEVSKLYKVLFVLMLVIIAMLFLLICAYIIYNVHIERKHSALVWVVSQ